MDLKATMQHAVEKLQSVIGYVPNQYEIQEMSDKAILENGGMEMSVPD